MSMMAATANVGSRLSLDNPELNVDIEKSNALIELFTSSPFNILRSRKEFEQKVNELNDSNLSSTITARQRPSDITHEVDAQLSFLRKLKFNYLEQHAKDKYIKTIVNDDSEIITIDDNESLRRSNEAKKARLKEAKERLAERYKQLEGLASEVEDRYETAENMTSEFGSLTSQILDARLALSRLRTSYPYPRLSVTSANATLESQTEAMSSLDAQLSENATKVEKLKERVQDAAREVERLRVERSAKEEEVRQTKTEEEDERIAGLYDWYTASLDLHRSLFSLGSMRSVSENELILSYRIDSRSSANLVPITLTLLFHPNTRAIADVNVASPDERISHMNLNDLIGSHVQSNDVLGLIAGVMARVRASI